MHERTARKTIRFSLPDAVHRKLKKRAASEGLTLSALLHQRLEIIAKRPTEVEMRKRLALISRETGDR